MSLSARGGYIPVVSCLDGHATESAWPLRKTIDAGQARIGLLVIGVFNYLRHVVLHRGHAVEAIDESITPVQQEAQDLFLIRSLFGLSRQQVIGLWQRRLSPRPGHKTCLMNLRA